MPFGILAEAYDAMIDWDKRLARETPFYRQVFQRVGARSVLDAACGTGRHAAMFHSWGMQVEAADLSEDMIAHCRQIYGQTADLQFEVRSFLLPPAREFDAVICAGNSLALVGDIDEVKRAICAMLAAVRPGGALTLQVLNLRSRPQGPVRWDKCQRATLSCGDALIVKGTHRAAGRGYVDVVVAELEKTPPRMTADSVSFLELDAESLRETCLESGADLVEIYGNFAGERFDAAASSDLIVVATKRTQE